MTFLGALKARNGIIKLFSRSAWGKYMAIDSKQIYFTDISRVYALSK